MNLHEYVGLAWESLRAHRLRTRMTAGAIAIGIGSVLIMTALGQGARDWVLEQFEALGTNVLIAIPGRTETRGGPPMKPATTRELTLDDMLEIPKRMAGVNRVVPIVVGESTVSYEGKGRTASLIGSTREFLRIRKVATSIGKELPDIEVHRTEPVCVIGKTIHRELFGSTNPLGSKVRIGEHSFRVIGVIAQEGQSMMVDLDEVVLVPVASAMQILNVPGLFRIIVEVSSFSDLKQAEARLNAILKDRHDGEEDFTILTPGAVAETLGRIIDIITMALAGIAAVSLAVAGIGIMNVMVVSVTERTGEVGLLKAVGAGNRQVLAMFLSEAIVLAMFGGAIGVAAGFLLTRVAYELYPNIPFRVPGWAIALAVGISASVGVVFGIVPAMRAARLEPLAALRKKV